MIIRITVSGCDDSTSIEMEATLPELAFLQEVADRLTEASGYPCMPTMQVWELQ